MDQYVANSRGKKRGFLNGKPLNQAIALIGIPWYNVIGNHDLNMDAADDQQSDETFERIYGPSYYSFDHGPAHFLVLDDVIWVGARDGQKAHYHGGLGERQIPGVLLGKGSGLLPDQADELTGIFFSNTEAGVNHRPHSTG